MEEKTAKGICSNRPLRQITVLPNKWWKFLEVKKPRHAGCYCRDKLNAAMRDVGIANNFLQLPEYDVAITLKLLEGMDAKEFDDMCEGLGNTNCLVIITELQL
jgi:hypothetical protein